MSVFLIAALCLVVLPLLLLVALNVLAPHAVARFLIGKVREKAGLKHREASIPGFTMPYLEGGTGAPLVLVHGFGGGRDNFLMLAARLTPHYRVLIPDLPGFAEATKDPKADYSVIAQAKRLAEWMQAIGLERAHFAGNSMGGWIIAELAATRPEKVLSLLMLNAAGMWTGTENDFSRRFRETGDLPLLVRSPADYDRMMSIVTSKPPKMPRAIKIYASDKARENVDLHSRIVTMFQQEGDYLDRRGLRIETPALIIWGEEDKVIARPAADSWQKVLVNSKLCLLPGIGHLPMIEAPKRTAEEYMAFLQGLKA